MSDNLKDIQQRISQNDERALTELYQHFHKKLQQFSTSLTRNKEVAEELVEDVFVKLWCNRKTITGIENITTYLYVAVKNRSLNFLSGKAKELIAAPFDFLDVELASIAADPYNSMITSEMMQHMKNAIETLPPRCRMIFKLVREDGLKYKEVAQVLNISVNTIDAQMAIAVKKVCESLHIKKPHKSPTQHQVKK